MGHKTGLLGSIALVMTLGLAGAANAQMGADLQFGDDSSAWANDGQCDDPRFEGPGAATFSVSADQMRDATDCQAALEAGTVTLVQGATPPPDDDAEDDQDDQDDEDNQADRDGQDDQDNPGGQDNQDDRDDQDDGDEQTNQDDQDEAAPLSPIDSSGIDFGDDSGSFPMDGECDDPRFAGAGVWSGANETGIRTDATDCRAAVEAGEAEFVGEPEPSDSTDTGMVDGIDFGDNASVWANDGECDDGRFEGEGMGLTNFSHVRMDANDCLAAYTAGTITYVGEGEDVGNAIDGIDFGDDSGMWANDGECDDARFAGEGMGLPSQDHIAADASDCRAAYAAGTIALVEEENSGAGEPIINFGDDSSADAANGVCDDPRFQGAGGASLLYPENRLADATDCRAAYEAGTVTLAP